MATNKSHINLNTSSYLHSAIYCMGQEDHRPIRAGSFEQLRITKISVDFCKQNTHNSKYYPLENKHWILETNHWEHDEVCGGRKEMCCACATYNKVV